MPVNSTRLSLFGTAFLGKWGETVTNEKCPCRIFESKKGSKKSNINLPEPDDTDWRFVYSNSQLKTITKTKDIINFCKLQHLKYLAHVARLDNDSFQKQIFFCIDHKKYSRDRWVNIEKELGFQKANAKIHGEYEEVLVSTSPYLHIEAL